MKGRKEPMETYLIYRDPVHPCKVAFVKQLEIQHDGTNLLSTDITPDVATASRDRTGTIVIEGCAFAAAAVATKQPH